MRLIRVLVHAAASPLGLALLLLAAALAAGRHSRFRSAALGSALALLAVFSSPIMSAHLMWLLESRYAPVETAALPPQQAIVVLGGYLRPPRDSSQYPDLNDAGDRLLTAVRLYAAARAPWLVLSGGPPQEARAAVRLAGALGAPAAAILVEPDSRDTHQNAAFTARLLLPRGLHRIALVTSAVHMPRAAAAFRAQGFAVVPVPTDFHSTAELPEGLSRFLPDANALADSASVLHELVGLLAYRAFGTL